MINKIIKMFGMKTNQIMIRNNEGFLQRTKDGYFSATSLINFWNENNPKNKKDLSKYRKNKSTIEFIEQLNLENIDKPYISSNKGTWMHPKLFIDFAMWISVEFKSIVIDYVLDGLIKTRNNAGDYYNEMTAEILNVYVDYYKKKPNPSIYINEAKFIRKLAMVNNSRNELSEKELNRITQLQKMNTVLIKKRYGKEKRKKMMETFSESLFF